jgi:hypothetical protein
MDSFDNFFYTADPRGATDTTAFVLAVLCLIARPKSGIRMNRVGLECERC